MSGAEDLAALEKLFSLAAGGYDVAALLGAAGSQQAAAMPQPGLGALEPRLLAGLHEAGAALGWGGPGALGEQQTALLQVG